MGISYRSAIAVPDRLDEGWLAVDPRVGPFALIRSAAVLLYKADPARFWRGAR